MISNKLAQIFGTFLGYPEIGLILSQNSSCYILGSIWKIWATLSQHLVILEVIRVQFYEQLNYNSKVIDSD